LAESLTEAGALQALAAVLKVDHAEVLVVLQAFLAVLTDVLNVDQAALIPVLTATVEVAL
jgi:hypothetical protein